jgi:SNF2 family DNA or RNA helicase
MEIIDNKAIAFRTRNPDKYRAVIPKSLVEVIPGGHRVVVYWGLDEMRVLKNMGVKNVPSPIERSYGWPGRYKPMAHQRVTAGFSTLHRRAFVFNDPGTAKTISVLWAADYLMSRGDVRRVLVICPLSIMHSAWMGDLNKSVIHRSAVVAHHSKASRRIECIQGDYEIVIINYDGVALVADEIIANGKFDLVIVDEANAYANHTTRRWKALAKILTPDTFLWMMTGTPAAQSPLHAYGLARLVNPSAVPRYANAWRDKVMHKVSTFKWIPKPNARDLVFEVLQPAIRFSKEQCLDLPPVLKTTREVPLTPQQLKYYNLLKSDMLAVAAGETIAAVNKAALVNKLLQVSAGVAYTENGEVIEFDCTPRLNLLLEILEETSRKVIIFAMHRATIDMVYAFLNKHGHATEVINGAVSATKRGDIINRFQYTDSPRVLVMQPQATAHGITLTAADTVVFYGPIPSVEQYTQCIARADRQGQTSTSVTVVHVQSSPVEKRMFDAMENRVTDAALLTQLFDIEMEGSKKA